MEYHEAADFLYGLRRFRMKPGTESTAEFLETLGNPHESISCVQIAGSNGKGSTAKMLESILRESGLSVGLYTSPHLESLRERIRVDGRVIPRSALTRFVDEVEAYVIDQTAAGSPVTFFEVVTALALWHFEREDIDVAVLEVGLGGRYDATSVVDPVASAVTNVSLEHTSVIGDTVEEIATDKAHVAPEDAPLVTGLSGSALEAAREIAGDVLTVGTGDDRDVRTTYEGRTNHTESAVAIAGDGWELTARIPVLGQHQADNAGIAVALARQFADVSDSDLRRGLRNAHWPGRFEVMETEPLVVLDGAHNPGACVTLSETLSTFEYDRLHLVFGAMHDKDHREMVPALPTPDSVYVCEPLLERAEDADVLASVFERNGATDVRTIPGVQDAVAEALAEADDDDAVVIAGSLSVVSEARTRWTGLDVFKRIETRSEARETLAGANAPKRDVDRAIGDAVHRVIETRLQYPQAVAIDREFSRVGGECVLSGIRRPQERTDVVLMGTDAQFEALFDRLAHDANGLGRIAEGLRKTLRNEAAAAERRLWSESGYPWADGPAIMGIVNVTPDSFHDGGRYDETDAAVSRAEAMIDAGATIVDVGGESTRPGADPVPVEEEIERVVPVVEGLADADALVSVDTRKAAVARAALEAGADVLNDVSGLEDPEMRFLAAEYDVPIVVMHSIDAPVVPDREVTYDDVVEDVVEELNERVLLAEKAGLDREQVIVDPGLGFGKSAPESFELLGRLEEFRALGCPIMVGHSHKSMFEHVGAGSGERLEATVAATALAVDRGADIVRVHDVVENVDAVRTALAASGQRASSGHEATSEHEG